MSSRYNRTNFLKIEEVEGTKEYDLIMTNFEYFKIQRPTNFYTIQRTDIGRPDLISLKLYQTIDFWWIIGEVNGICDFNYDIKEGDIIQVPDRLDIEDFYLKVRNL